MKVLVTKLTGNAWCSLSPTETKENGCVHNLSSSNYIMSKVRQRIFNELSVRKRKRRKNNFRDTRISLARTTVFAVHAETSDNKNYIQNFKTKSIKVNFVQIQLLFCHKDLQLWTSFLPEGPYWHVMTEINYWRRWGEPILALEGLYRSYLVAWFCWLLPFRWWKFFGFTKQKDRRSNCRSS